MRKKKLRYKELLKLNIGDIIIYESHGEDIKSIILAKPYETEYGAQLEDIGISSKCSFQDLYEKMNFSISKIYYEEIKIFKLC